MYEGTIASVTPTVCGLFQIDQPALCGELALDEVMRYAGDVLHNHPVERCLIYCPDALGDQIWSRCPEHCVSVASHAPRVVHVSSVVPPKTPVCFASMFTGAMPERHGIRKYERPVLACETLFDALIRAGRRVAIVAVQNSSVDLIFRNRDIDYFSEIYDEQTTVRALAVLEEDRHDLVVVYHQEYDDLLHETEPFSERCLQAATNHVTSFARLASAAYDAWADRHAAVVFAPDHGAHVDANTGHGDHGLDIPEDMSLRHWYGAAAPRE